MWKRKVVCFWVLLIGGLVIVGGGMYGKIVSGEHTRIRTQKGIKETSHNKDIEKGTNLTELEQTKQQQREKEDKLIDTWLEKMSLEEKLAQRMILTNEKDITTWTLNTYQPGGVIFFGTDFQNKTINQVAERVNGLQDCMNIPLFIGVDEEGGSISRVKGLLDEIPTFESARTSYSKGRLHIQQVTEDKVKLLKKLGVNLNFDPVADVVTDKKSYMYERSASGDAQEVSEYVEIVLSVMKNNNMGGCLKHFPGYGNNVNTHTGVASDSRSLQEYEKTDFLPYYAGMAAGAEMIMVSHITMEQIDAENPASLSVKVHELLREELDFDGVVIADDLNMQAILQQMSLETATGMAFAAGNDMIFSADFMTSLAGAKKAIQNGLISEENINESVKRILRYKLHLGLLEDKNE